MLDFDCYPDILDSIKKGALFLDLACCFAQEVRQVVSNNILMMNGFRSLDIVAGCGWSSSRKRIRNRLI